MTAANPAARELHPCPDCDPLHKQYRERIRALEAELERWKLQSPDALDLEAWEDVCKERDALKAERDRLQASNDRMWAKMLELKARVAELKKDRTEARTVSFRVAEQLMRIALDAPCACVPNGEACLGHEFLSIYYQEKGALKDDDPERVIEHVVLTHGHARNSKEAP